MVVGAGVVVSLGVVDAGVGVGVGVAGVAGAAGVGGETGVAGVAGVAVGVGSPGVCVDPLLGRSVYEDPLEVVVTGSSSGGKLGITEVTYTLPEPL